MPGFHIVPCRPNWRVVISPRFSNWPIYGVGVADRPPMPNSKKWECGVYENNLLQQWDRYRVYLFTRVWIHAHGESLQANMCSLGIYLIHWFACVNDFTLISKTLCATLVQNFSVFPSWKLEAKLYLIFVLETWAEFLCVKKTQIKATHALFSKRSHKSFPFVIRI